MFPTKKIDLNEIGLNKIKDFVVYRPKESPLNEIIQQASKSLSKRHNFAKEICMSVGGYPVCPQTHDDLQSIQEIMGQADIWTGIIISINRKKCFKIILLKLHCFV